MLKPNGRRALLSQEVTRHANSWVPKLLMNGVDWYKAQGRNGLAGLKFVGVSGDVRNPGVFEISMGTLAWEVIYGLGRAAARQTVQSLGAIRSVFRLLARIHDGRAAVIQSVGRRRIDAWLRHDCGLRGRPVHAGYGAERGPIFPQ